MCRATRVPRQLISSVVFSADVRGGVTHAAFTVVRCLNFDLTCLLGELPCHSERVEMKHLNHLALTRILQNSMEG